MGDVTLRMAIVGYGFVGKAVDYGFEHKDLEKTIIDPALDEPIEKYRNRHFDVAFVCVPTPMGADGSVNGDIVKSVVEFLKYETKTNLIVIKSTVTPNIVYSLQIGKSGDRVVYNPEFLTERNYAEDFINPDFHIFGGKQPHADSLHYFYKTYSKCKDCPAYYMTGPEASFTKYAINSFLATKVLWFNQLHDACLDYNCDYNTVLKAMTADHRITDSHTQVPGFDGKQGFGGACFPKDTAAFYNFDNRLTVIKEAIDRNNEYRSQYEKDERELEQNVRYND